ncbi:hypothetical protein L9F63_019146, partial [Diploptera punctata]
QNQRLQTELANNEVQHSSLEAQLRLARWPAERTGTGIITNNDEELQSSQRERMELRGKLDLLQIRFASWRQKNTTWRKPMLRQQLIAVRVMNDKYKKEEKRNQNCRTTHPRRRCYYQTYPAGHTFGGRQGWGGCGGMSSSSLNALE